MVARFIRLLGLSWQAIFFLRVKVTAKTMIHVRSLFVFVDVLYHSQRFSVISGRFPVFLN